MEIIKLPVGHVAAEDTDCIRIQQLPAGTFELNGSVLASCGDAESFESVSMVASDPYPTLDAAESAGLAWANEHCVERLYVAHSDGTKPLPDPV